MTSSFTWKQIGLAAACALALGMVSGAARTQTVVEETSYLVDGQGTVVTSGFGLCWRTVIGPAPLSTPECDPDYLPPTVARRAAPAARPGPVATLTPPPVPRHPPIPSFALRPAAIPAIQKVVLDADALFDFDKAELSPAGRAEAVKDYLVSKGVDPNRVRAEGKGDTQPATKAGACDGGRSAKVIACLQPDRRVVIEVAGTRKIRIASNYGSSERLDPGQDATHVLDAEFPVAALKAKNLKEIRLALTYVPSPYREEMLNFTVSIGGQ